MTTPAALIVNPKSGGANRKGLELAAMLEGSGAQVHVLEEFARLPEILDECAAAGIEALFISSGDGTIQEIQTRIAEDGRFTAPPALCLLPHGSTNMTAADIGFRARSLRAQRDFIQFSGWRATSARSTTRPTVRIANPADGRPRHGMFLGGGAIAAATFYCQESFNRRGLRGGPANFATLATATIKALFGGRPDPDDESRFDRPFPMTIRTRHATMAQGDQLAVLVTTLRKLVLGARPFWGGSGKDMRISIFGYPPPFLPRWLPFVLYGGEERDMPPGMQSFTAREVEMEAASRFVLDGEPVDPPADEAMKVTLGSQFTYLLG